MQIISRKEAIAQGLSRYFTGEPCGHGHIDERYVSGKTCRACQKMRDWQYSRIYKAKLALAYRALRELGIEI